MVETNPSQNDSWNPLYSFLKMGTAARRNRWFMLPGAQPLKGRLISKSLWYR